MSVEKHFTSERSFRTVLQNGAQRRFVFVECAFMRCVTFANVRGVARISRRWGGGGGPNWFHSTYVQDFGVYATQTEDAVVAVERACLSLPPYLFLGGK